MVLEKKKENPRSNSRLRLHERHAGGLVAVGVDGRHHLAADRVEDGQRGEGPGDLAVLGHAPQLFAGLLDGAVMDQLDAGQERGADLRIISQNATLGQNHPRELSILACTAKHTSTLNDPRTQNTF